MGSGKSIDNGGGSSCIGGGSGDITRDGITKLGRNGGGTTCIEGDGICIQGEGLGVHGGGSGG